MCDKFDSTNEFLWCCNNIKHRRRFADVVKRVGETLYVILNFEYIVLYFWMHIKEK